MQLGAAVSQMEKRGIRTERGDQNHAVEVTNRGIFCAIQIADTKHYPLHSLSKETRRCRFQIPRSLGQIPKNLPLNTNRFIPLWRLL